jgi:FdrA protein
VALKRRAVELGLLFMGADCGTAIIDGVALGFANAVRRGPVGIVGASGTGIQEVSCLLDAAGIGVSHAIGVGGRDLSAEVGGLMTRAALELLAGDPGTERIIVISKPPDPEVAAAIEAIDVGKPVTFAYRTTLQEAAGGAPADDVEPAPAPGRVRGIYSGGTLCTEAAALVPDGEFTDYGDDEYTRGRAHPMIDQSLRIEALQELDPSFSVVLLDVVLGYGAHPDPAGELAPVIEGIDKHVIVALVGADGDPQGLDAQRERLEAAGAVVVRGNATAARLARESARGDRGGLG